MKCQICGARAGHPVSQIPFFRRVSVACERCSRNGFWLEKILIMDDPRVVRIGGKHYMLRELRAPRRSTVEAHVLFHDGRRASSRKLFHQGEIPSYFRRALPDNAEFVPRCMDSSAADCSIPVCCSREQGHRGRHEMGYIAWRTQGQIVYLEKKKK